MRIESNFKIEINRKEIITLILIMFYALCVIFTACLNNVDRLLFNRIWFYDLSRVGQ